MAHPAVLRADGETRDLGYPVSVQLDDASIFTVYYHTAGGVTHAVGEVGVPARQAAPLERWRDGPVGGGHRRQPRFDHRRVEPDDFVRTCLHPPERARLSRMSTNRAESVPTKFRVSERCRT